MTRTGTDCSRVRLGRRALLGALLGLALMPATASAAPPTMTRAQIIDRAAYGVGYSYWWGHGAWRTDGQYPGSCSGSCPGCTHSGSYGADCSGYVAKAWQVPSASDIATDGHPYSTASFRWETTWWNQVGWGDALIADAFVYRNSANTGGHIVLYESGDPWGSIWTYEAKGCSYGVVHNLKQLSSAYVAIRRVGLQETPQNGTLRGVIFEDLGVGVADMSVRLPGAQVDCAGQGSTTASAPDGEWAFDLPPGSYVVTASAPGHQSASRTCSVTAGQDAWCSIGLIADCTPDCTGRVCGLEPVCGEPCGSCAPGAVCLPGGQCEEVTTCNLDCTGRDCGPDPVCGESCGVCPSQLACGAAGTCEPISASDAKIFGYVVAVSGGTPTDLTVYPPVPGAMVSINGEPLRETDYFGYFEVLLEAGTYQLSATAEGYEPGEAECTVTARGYTECLIPVYEPGAGPVDPVDPGREIPTFRGGCQCEAGGPGEGGVPVAPLLVFLGLLVALRRRRRQ